MAAVMQPPRPSMDRSASFEQTRRPHVNSTQFGSPSLQRPSLSQTPSHNSAQGTHHRHSFTNNTHSRSSSSASTQQVQVQRPASIKQSSSPYQQPYPQQNQYFPQSQSMYSIPQQPWTSSALPASQFHAPPFHSYGGGGGNQVFHPGFQQSQAEFAAWAGAYGQAMANQQPHYGQQQQQHMFNSQPQTTEYLHEDRERTRSVSSPQSTTPNINTNVYDRSQSPPTSATSSKPVQAFHPYKRQPGHRPSRENMANASVTGMPRSASQPIISRSPAPTPAPAPAPAPVEQVNEVAPPRRAERSSESSERERPIASTRTYANATTGTGASAKTSTPLHTGPIANAASNTAAPRPSPLSNSAPTPEPEKKEKGFKGRFKKALGGGGGGEKRAQSTTPAATISKSPTPTRANAPQQHYTHDVPLNPPHAPFTNQGAMGSDVSLANTERTTTTLTGGPGDEGKEKKRSMFRMKNMSTDNISLSSTVSSASMMIRRMGSIGKLARRNSLAGISKIFKDKPKDEDAALPEKEIKKAEKKQAKQDKKDRKKASAAPATVSHATVEQDKPINDDDRALAGLSPAAKLARQHTLRSKAEQQRAQAEKARTGEPTWDNNTQTRNTAPVLPSIESLTSGLSTLSTEAGPEVVRVQPRSTRVVHAVNVADHEYDSEDDSSDGETVEDATISLARTRFSQETERSLGGDDEFRAEWGNSWIDRNAVPKKGILKQYHSYTEGQNRLRSTSNAGGHHSIGPMAQIPPSNPAQIDGLAHPHPQRGVEFAEHLDDSPSSIGDFRGPIYSNPAQNSSEPLLNLNHAVTGARLGATGRSMTAPASKRLEWAPECAVYSTYDAGTYDRRSEPATCNRLTPELAMAIKQELNAFKLEMPVHPQSRGYTHYFA